MGAKGKCFGIWRRKMSEPVRQAIAGMTFGDGKLEEVLRLADAVERTTNVPGQVAAT